MIHLQFNLMQDQGTRIIIYNLWEDDEGQLELDFDFDQHVCLLWSLFTQSYHIMYCSFKYTIFFPLG